MANLIPASTLVADARKALDDKVGYIYGKLWEKWTASKQEAYRKTYLSDPVKYKARKLSAEKGDKWIGHTVTDCSGLIKHIMEERGGSMYHGSNSMYRSYCTAKGALKAGVRDDGKELKPGTAVFTGSESDRGHVGIYAGDGIVIEAQGTNAGVTTSKVSATKWTWWGELKGIDYGEATSVSISEPVEKPQTAITYPTLREGAKGDLVYMMQDLLSKNGSSLLVDGIFGSGTRSAVRAFQQRNGLVVDGICGPKTWAKLLETGKDETPRNYTVTISGLSEAEAQDLLKRYSKSKVSVS